MPLPTDPKAPWPPKAWAPILRDVDEASAWYSGDESRLINFYGDAEHTIQQTGPGGKLISMWSRFWARRTTDSQTARQRIHVPAAADVAATSADLLFGDEPRIVIPEAHEFDTTSPDPELPAPARLSADPTAVAAEERLAELAEDDGWARKLLEGAEICAALGDVYLRPVWDKAVAGHPMLDIVHPDYAIPEFRWGRLVAITFWREVPTPEGNAVWRHLERHEVVNDRGVILHGLYVGTRDALGISRPLVEHPELASLQDIVAMPEGVGLDVRHVKNALNRKHRGFAVGRADVAGCEPLMDSLDEAFSSWMREIRLVKPRIVVPNEFLERGRKSRGSGAWFDVDAEVFAPLDMDPANQDRAGITIAEFTLHTEQYAATCENIFSKIVGTAGYSAQSFGIQSGEGADVTATEWSGREGKSWRTTARKQRYWRAAEEVLELIMIVDRAEFGSTVEPMRPRFEFVDPDASNPREIGSTLNLINLARAASVVERVRMLHSDWDEPRVQEEAQRIKEEEGLGAVPVPDPTGGLP